MQKLIAIIFIIFLSPGSELIGQDVNFRASAKNVVRTGERFQLVYSVNGEGKNFRPPSIEGFNILSGPSTSQSSSIQIINGSVSRTVEYTFTFILQAKGEEKIFDIPAAKVTVKGKVYTSNPLKIQVVKSGTTQQRQQQGGSQSKGTTTLEDLKDEVFVKAVLNKSTPMQGEQVVITYKLYFRINIAGPEFTKEPSFKGFWVNDLLQNRQNLPQYQEVYKGQNFHVAELKKLALFPQRSGEFNISPLKVKVQAQIRAKTKSRSNDPFESFFNDPFFSRYQTIDVPLASNSLTIKVKPLPAANKPADYSGAVGKFTFNSSIDKTELKTNEAINLKFTVSGTGNVELVDKINVSFPPDFEVYDPKVTKNMKYIASGVTGKKTFEYLLIPRAAGNFTIDPVEFTYFDLSKKQYVTLRSPVYDIKVERGDDSESGFSFTGTNQSDIGYIDSDIQHIRVGDPGLQIIGAFFFGSNLYLILLAVPLGLFILFVMIWKKELKKRSNLAIMKNRKATKVARKKMKKAETFMKENSREAFYEEVSQALWGYLSDKFSIPLANLSIDTVNATLKVKEVKEETILKFTDTLNNCEFARFAPGDSHTAMENIYNESINLISHMERELR